MTISDLEIETLRGTVVFLGNKEKIAGVGPEWSKPYYGKIHKYDSETLTLNPYLEGADLVVIHESKAEGFEISSENIGKMMNTHVSNMYDLFTAMQKIEPGTSNREKTFRRENITTLYDFMG